MLTCLSLRLGSVSAVSVSRTVIQHSEYVKKCALIMERMFEETLFLNDKNQLQIEFSSVLVHYPAFKYPLVLSVLRIKDSFLEPSQFKREPWSQLLQPSTRLVFLLAIYIPMVPYKDIVALVVKGNYLSAFKLRFVRKE